MKPLARWEGLVIRDLPDEVVVYDERSHQAHCLNSTAALVFRLANGRRTAAEIAALLGPGADHAFVHAALQQLTAAGLLETCPASPAPAPSRRELLRQVGLGAALLAPVVTSLLVPSPAQAAATCIPAANCNPGNVGQPCYNSNPATECSLNVCQTGGACTP